MSAHATYLPAPVTETIANQGWLEFAVCRRQGALFFEPFGERPGRRRRREALAKQLCSQCPVHDVCLEAGRRNHESGIWGGETDEERALAGYPPRASVRRSVIGARNAVRMSAESANRSGEGGGAD